MIDSTGVVISRDLLPVRFAPGAGIAGVHESLTLAPGNNTVTVPAGAIALLLELTSAAPPLTLKGVNGDTGTTIAPTTNPAGVAMLLPLGTNPSLVIVNGGAAAYAVDATFV